MRLFGLCHQHLSRNRVFLVPLCDPGAWNRTLHTDGAQYDWLTETDARSVMYDALQPHRLQPTRLLCPWDSPGKNIQWVAMTSSRGSSQPRDQTCISCVSCIGTRILYHWATWEAPKLNVCWVNAMRPSHFTVKEAEICGNRPCPGPHMGMESRFLWPRLPFLFSSSWVSLSLFF